MPASPSRPSLAALPAVQQVLRDPAFVRACAALGDAYRTRLVRRVLDRHRERLRAAPDAAPTRAELGEGVVAACAAEAERVTRAAPRRVINGTGVLIHTNLGRAPLGDLLTGLDLRALAGYADLEWDAATQGRGERDQALREQLQLLTGAESAVVVNNCASALLLALHTLAPGRDVLVSRSELVEIGGSFRVPEIIEASGCRLREVGTTNRTRIDDFARHATPGASVLLKVHQSNFVQRGFVEQVAVEELVALGRRLGVPVVEDNGSGLLAAAGVASGPAAAALAGEPEVAASLARGVDVVCWSGDKLFGGVQAGLIAGGAAAVDAMRRNPLYRALRLDKVRVALLDRALKAHLAGRAAEIPLWRLFNATVAEVEARVDRLRLPDAATRWSACRRVPLRATLGGGSNPEVDFPSAGLELSHRDLTADEVRRRFAAHPVPIAGYVQQDRFHLDFRAVLDDDLPEIQQALDALGAPGCAAGPSRCA